MDGLVEVLQAVRQFFRIHRKRAKSPMGCCDLRIPTGIIKTFKTVLFIGVSLGMDSVFNSLGKLLTR